MHSQAEISPTTSSTFFPLGARPSQQLINKRPRDDGHASYRPRAYCLVACLLEQHHVCTAAQSLPPPPAGEAEAEAELLLQIKRDWGDPPELAAWNATSPMAAGSAH